MSSTQALVAVLKAELKAAGWTYARLAPALGLAESSVKRMFARGEMPLSRVDQICALLKTDFAELARQVAAQPAPRPMLTEAQEAAVVADPKLLLVALCVLSQWTAEQIVATYRLGEAELVALLVRLDQLGVIELRPGNRYRLRLSRMLRWRPDGPVMRFFRQRVLADYFNDGFDGPGELLMLVHGEIGTQRAASFNERLQRLAEDLARQHLADQHLAAKHKRPYTLLVGLRSWLFADFRGLMRVTGAAGAVGPAGPAGAVGPAGPTGAPGAGPVAGAAAQAPASNTVRGG